tara:strand:- start:72 stop:596 length:525 start_codon:yes stop_codon:yes gene_type:complete
MGFDECYHLGNVIKTHGLQGEVILFLDVDDPEYYKKLESILIEINGKLIPFFIRSIQINHSRATVKLEEIDNVDAASDFVGKDVYLPLEKLPRLKEGQYYYHQLVGFEVLNDTQLIGKVTEIYHLATNDLIGVDHNGTEVLIPLEDEIVLKVDLENKQILTHLPDGLLNVYLDQ